MPYNKLLRKIKKLLPNVAVTEERGCIVLRGEADDWKTAVKAGQAAVNKKKYHGVINDITLNGFTPRLRLPSTRDNSLDGERPDVLIIGGGITGCAIARELSRWKLDVILTEKGPDVANGQSKANGGVLHVGLNFSPKSQKFKYCIRGNKMYGELSKELDVPFEQNGQVVFCSKLWEKFLFHLMSAYAKKVGYSGVRYMKRKELLKHEPHLPAYAIGGLFMPTGGITNPCEMTVALMENAAKNNVRICLNTAVLGMELSDGHITGVKTNRGTLHPRLVINAAGVHSDEIADMAGDRTFSIHPRRGTDIITDKKTGYLIKTSMGKAPFAEILGKSHTKGVALIHSVHGNMLIGPNAVETPEKENTATYRNETDDLIKEQQKVAPALKHSDVIAYFTGVRGPTYEEDFVVRRGIFTDNIIEAAGIQSPGITAAPAIAADITEWTLEYLSKTAGSGNTASGDSTIEKNKDFSPHRTVPPRLAMMDDVARAAFIKQNPDYGIIVCRCEEISRGEILDALNSPLCVPTLDGIKRRVRPGMGRCQGGFCSPLVMQIIAEHQGVSLSEVKKSSPESIITYGETKGSAP